MAGWTAVRSRQLAPLRWYAASRSMGVPGLTWPLLTPARGTWREEVAVREAVHRSGAAEVAGGLAARW